jgi:hypothetical protein
LGDQIKEKEICGACGTYGENEKCVIGVWWGKPKGKDYLEDLVIDGIQ